jgi:hypothetical protein
MVVNVIQMVWEDLLVNVHQDLVVNVVKIVSIEKNRIKYKLYSILY